MSDYISREAAEEVFRNARKSLNAQKYDYMANEYLTRDTMLLNAEQIIHALPAADVRPKWISVEERLPELHDAEYLDEVTGELIRYKESAPILIWLAKGGFMDIGIYEKSDSVDDFCYQGVPHTVTYWMPLPEVPKEVSE